MGSRVVFGDQADAETGQQADGSRDEDAQAGVGLAAQGEVAGQEVVDEQVHDGDHDGGRAEFALVQAGLGIAALLDRDHEGAEDRDDDARARDDEGQGDEDRIVDARHEDAGAQHHGTEDGAHVGFEEVGAHSRHVAHVVAHVIGDGGRIEGMVLGNPRLYLAHQVGAHVGRLGVDSPAHAGEEGDGRSTQREAGDDVQHPADTGFVDPEKPRVENEQAAEAQDTQAHHVQAHDRPAGKGHVQCLGQSGPRRVGRPRIGPYGHAHAQESGQAGSQGAGDEGQGDEGAGLDLAHVRHGQQHSHDHDEYRQDPVLRLQEGHGAFGNAGTDGFHPVRPLILPVDPGRPPDSVDQSQQARDDHTVHQLVLDHVPLPSPLKPVCPDDYTHRGRVKEPALCS